MSSCKQCNKSTKSKQFKYCSHECYWKSKIGKKHSWGYKIGDALRGISRSPEHIQKVIDALKGKKRPNLSGEKHPNWKGSKIGYAGLHDWVYKEKGYAKKCETCRIGGYLKNGKWNVHWANKSHKYKRSIDDWIALCRKCHYRYDLERQKWKQ